MLGLALAVAVAIDLASGFEGSALRYNQRLEQIVRRENLIGANEAEVVAALGEPSYRYSYPKGDYTLNYAPSWLLAVNKFQAHFRSDGTLRAVELMD